MLGKRKQTAWSQCDGDDQDDQDQMAAKKSKLSSGFKPDKDLLYAQLCTENVQAKTGLIPDLNKIIAFYAEDLHRMFPRPCTCRLSSSCVCLFSWSVSTAILWTTTKKCFECKGVVSSEPEEHGQLSEDGKTCTFMPTNPPEFQAHIQSAFPLGECVRTFAVHVRYADDAKLTSPALVIFGIVCFDPHGNIRTIIREDNSGDDFSLYFEIDSKSRSLFFRSSSSSQPQNLVSNYHCLHLCYVYVKVEDTFIQTRQKSIRISIQ